MLGKFISPSEQKNIFKISGNNTNEVLSFTYDVYDKVFKLSSSAETVLFNTALDKFTYYDGNYFAKINSTNNIEIYDNTNTLLASVNGFNYENRFYVKNNRLIFQISNKSIKVIDLDEVFSVSGFNDFRQIKFIEGQNLNELNYGYSIDSYSNYLAVGSSAKKVDIINNKTYGFNSYQEIFGENVLDGFGYSVSVNNNYIFVGAPFYSINEKQSGKVYIYKNESETFILEQEIEIEEKGLNFGFELDSNDDFLFIYAKSRKTKYSGKVFIYRLNVDTWEYFQTLETGIENDNFGYKIKCNNTHVIISSVFNVSGETLNNKGVVRLYRFSSLWELSQTLVGESNGDNFGSDISIENNLLIVGAKNYNSKGAFYLYDFITDTWVLNQRFDELDSSVGDFFGYSVEISDNLLYCTAPNFSSLNYDNCGKVYVYSFSDDTVSLEQTMVGNNDYERIGYNIHIIDSENFIINSFGYN